MRGTNGSVIVAKRVEEGRPDTEEVRDLARAAGYTVAGEVTQTRTEDPALCLGEGKVAELAEVVAEVDATAVVFDNRLGPYQTFNLGTELPDGVEVIDRFRLILDIFGQRARTKKAQLQVELAELRYELPRAEAKASLAKRDERPGFMGLGEYDESREQLVPQLRQLHLELGLPGPGALPEDVQNQPEPVDDLGAVRELLAEVVRLVGAEAVVEDHAARVGPHD